MNLTTLDGSTGFWDNFAPWYEKWITRGHYHQRIIKEMAQMIEPGWHVLDIGAATGVLSIPMAALGCRVTALEPSEGMRRIFSEKLSSLSVQNITIVPKRWEDLTPSQNTSYDLILACNSLHLTEGGFIRGMNRVFSFQPAYVCLITEINLGIFDIDFKEIDMLQKDFTFLYIKKHILDSTFYFEDMFEMKDLSRCIGRSMKITLEGEKPVQSDKTDLAIVWWERK